MKAKILASVLAIGLIAFLIGGNTMAWFTDEAEVAEAEFVAGTVVINADEGEEFIKVPDGKSFKNVNPGDCATVTWEFVNEGTKAIELRVKLTELWEATTDQSLPGYGVTLDTDNVYYAPLPGSGWVMYEDEDGELWLYYANGPVRGTFNYENEDEPLDPAEVSLALVVGFDGEATDNDYQGATYILGGSAIDEETGEIIGSVVEAVQASNNAPEAVWGSDFWNAVKAAEGLYAGEASDENLAYVYANYFLNDAGYNMPCWPKDEEEPSVELYNVTADINIEGAGTVTGDGEGIEEGTEVELIASASGGFVFTGWELPDGVSLLDGYSLTDSTIKFIMPANHVNVTANFEEEVIPDSEIASFDYKITQKKGVWGYLKWTEVKGYIENLKYDNGESVSGEVSFDVIIKDWQGNVKASQTFTRTFDNGEFRFTNNDAMLIIDDYAFNPNWPEYDENVYITINGISGNRI